MSKLPPADDATNQLHPLVRGVLAQNLADPATVEGAALSATTAARTSPIGGIAIESFLLPGETLDPTGTTSMSTIAQRAFDQTTVAAGDSVQIVWPKGIFRIGTALTPRSGVGIIGAGETATRLKPVGANAFIDGNRDTVWGGAYLDDLVFKNFTVDGSLQAPVAGYNFAIKGFFMQHLRRARFESVTVVDTHATGFGVDALEDSWFVNCTAKRAGRGVPSNRNGTGAGFGIGMGFSDVESVTIINCTSLDNYTHGYFIEHLDRDGAVHYSTGFKLIGSTARGNWNGFLDAGARGALVQGNVFIGNLYAGIALRGTGAAAQAGIDGVASGNVIRSNGASAGGGVMIVDSSAGGYTFVANEITKNAGPGIWAPSTAKVGPGLRIHDNHIEGNTGDGVLIETPSVARLSIRGNSVERNTGSGIKLASALARPVIRENQSHENAGYGLVLAGSLYSTTPDIQGNNLTGNTLDGLSNTHTVDVSTYITANITDTAASLTNLLADPGFEANTTGATSLNATLSRPNVGAAAHGGSFVMRGTYSGVGGTGYGAISTTGVVAAGDFIRGRIWAKGVAGRKLYASLNTGPGGGQIIGPKVIATGAWQLLETSGIIPSGKTTCRIAAYVDTDAAIVTGELLDVDDVELVKIT